MRIQKKKTKTENICENHENENFDENFVENFVELMRKIFAN